MTRDALVLPPRRMAYAPSTLLRGLEWLGPPARYPGSGSDMHWWAWGDDDAIYCADDDGTNFDQGWHFAHFLRVTGIPPHHEVHEISQFDGLRRHDMRRLRYVCGTTAVGSRLYVAAYDYNFIDPGREMHRLDGHRAVSVGDESFFTDALSQHAGVVALMYSDDYGVSWQNLPDEHTPYFLGPKFGGLAFVGFGPGYSGVPEHLGAYVYAISNDENWEGGCHVYLARVARDRMLDREAWEFYGGGRDFDAPVWSTEEQDARPVLSDYGHVGHPTMTYNAALGRFLLLFGSDVVPHSYATPRDFARANWHHQRELQIYEGKTPWGPWFLVHYEPNWEGGHVAYLPQLPSKWLSDDGLSGMLLFSGDYSMHRRPPGYESFYGFMTRPFRFST